MKLSDIRPTIETSGELEEQFFSIQDQGMIFDILRNKMYSNPILAICREISCNARDAHREMKKADVPIHIYLPNNLEPFYKIKDFGPGISPDRMSNIFIKYTASTKRSDNVQTGGFGLGAKTPFSYSDTFTILTNHDGKQYNYACFIDETKVGKLVLLGEVNTKEPNGTEIIIPVKPVDFRLFLDWTENATRHWDVKPIIKGGAITWQEGKKIIEGTDWTITAPDNNNYSYQRSIKLVIDGIEYPLDLTTLKTYADTKLIDSARGTLNLYFGVGELSLSASREQVYLDKATQQKIKTKLDGVIKEIKQKVLDKIQAFPNLWEANVYYKQELTQAFSNIGFLGVLDWQGFPLNQNGYISVDTTVFSFHKGKYSRKYGTDPDKLTRSMDHVIKFDASSTLFVNDLPLKEPTPKHLKKAFEDNPKLASVQVVCPIDTAALDKLNKNFHLDKMGTQLLSTITKASGRAYTPATSRLLVFKYDVAIGDFRQVSYASIEEDTNDKVLCKLTKETYPNRRQVYLKNKKQLSLNALKSVSDKFPKTSFYGVDTSTPDDRIKEDLSDFADLDVFLDNKILLSQTINYVEIKFALSHNYHVDERLIKCHAQTKSAIKDPQSLFIKKVELHKKIKDLCTGDLGLLNIYESVKGEISPTEVKKFALNNPDFDLDKINQSVAKKYPLLEHVNSYNYSQIVDHVAEYVNLIDAV